MMMTCVQCPEYIKESQNRFFLLPFVLAMLSLFGRKQVSEEQHERLNRRCSAVKKAYQSCLRANSGESGPCQFLETSAVACHAEVTVDWLGFQAIVLRGADMGMLV